MNKEFIPYEQARVLKELGFDEPCLGYFDPLLGDYVIINSDCPNPKPSLFNHNISSIVVSAPLYQQAFRWFREKYGLYADIYRNGVKFNACIEDLITGNSKETVTDNGVEFEEAELECLIKLIEIVK
jgi:hypothetical protein